MHSCFLFSCCHAAKTWTKEKEPFPGNNNNKGSEIIMECYCQEGGLHIWRLYRRGSWWFKYIICGLSVYIILGIEMGGDKKNCGIHVKKHQGSLLCVRAYNAMFYKRVPVCTHSPTLENLCSSCIFGRNTVCQIWLNRSRYIQDAHIKLGQLGCL